MSDFDSVVASIAEKATLEEKLQYALTAIAVLTTHKKATEGMINDIMNIPGVLELVIAARKSE